MQRENGKVIGQVGLGVVMEDNERRMDSGKDESNNSSQLEVATENLHSNLQTLMELWITGDTVEDTFLKEGDVSTDDTFASWSDDVRCAFLEVQLMILKDYRRYCVRKRGSGRQGGPSRLADMFDQVQFLDSNPKDHRPFLEVSS